MKLSDNNNDGFEWLCFTDYIKWILLASVLCLLLNGGWILTILGILFIFYGLYRKAKAEYYFDVIYPRECEENKRKYQEKLDNMTEEEKKALQRIKNMVHK